MEKSDVPTKKRPDIAILAVGAVAVIALVVGGVTWFAFPGKEAASPAQEGKSKSADGLPPLRALPPPGTDLLPALRTPPPDTPAPAASQEAGGQAASPAPTIALPPPQAKVAPTLPVTPAPPTAERQASTTAPAQGAKRAEKATDATTGVLPGRYVGNITGADGGGLTLVIASADGGVVKATASLASGGVCDDNYAMQGSVRGGRLDLRAPRMGGRAGDCPLSLSLVVDGNRMTGTSGSGGSVQLTKR